MAGSVEASSGRACTSLSAWGAEACTIKRRARTDWSACSGGEPRSRDMHQPALATRRTNSAPICTAAPGDTISATSPRSEAHPPWPHPPHMTALFGHSAIQDPRSAATRPQHRPAQHPATRKQSHGRPNDGRTHRPTGAASLAQGSPSKSHQHRRHGEEATFRHANGLDKPPA